jgi:hypothetical protein
MKIVWTEPAVEDLRELKCYQYSMGPGILQSLSPRRGRLVNRLK